jgi:hypothetical protein
MISQSSTSLLFWILRRQIVSGRRSIQHVDAHHRMMCAARSLTTDIAAAAQSTGGEEDNTFPHLRQCVTAPQRSLALIARSTTAEGCHYIARLAAVSSREVEYRAGRGRGSSSAKVYPCRRHEGIHVVHQTPGVLLTLVDLVQLLHQTRRVGLGVARSQR